MKLTNSKLRSVLVSTIKEYYLRPLSEILEVYKFVYQGVGHSGKWGTEFNNQDFKLYIRPKCSVFLTRSTLTYTIKQ
jgi:hypothetical protein